MIKKWLKKSAMTLLAMSLLVPSVSLTPVNAATVLHAEEVAADSNVTNDFTTTKKKIEEYASALTSFCGATSVQYALIDNGKVVLSGGAGYATVESKTAPTANTLYGIGSISKVYTTAAVMKLVEEGKVDLDEPVTKYIKDFKMEDERYKDITVRMLLNHTSGLLGSNINNTMMLGDRYTKTMDRFLEILSKQKLKADPGAYAVYCNDGFTLAQILVERVSGMDFTTFLHQTITKPLNLKNTKTGTENFVTRKMAHIYGASGQLPFEAVTCTGAGGIVATAEDLSAFGQVFTKDSNAILSRNSVDEMSKFVGEDKIWTDDLCAKTTYGLGWDNVKIQLFEQYGIKALEKGGDSVHYHSSLIVLPNENISIAVLSSEGRSSYNKLAAEQTLLSYLQEKGRITELKELKPFNQNLPAQTMPEEYKEYAGDYANTSLIYQIKMTDRGLHYVNSAYNVSLDLDYYRDGWFKYGNGELWLRLCTCKNGKKYIYCLENGSIPKIGESIEGSFLAEKLEDYQVNENDVNAWKQRAGKIYYNVTEKYTSETMEAGVNGLGLPTKEQFIMGKYLHNMKIQDTSNAVLDLQIPILNGRDLICLSAETIDGVEYMHILDSTYVDEKAVPDLPKKQNFTVTIPATGYTQYYKFYSDSDSKTIKADLPENAAFIVYDGNGKVVFHSYLQNATETKLPSGGTIAVFGDANTTINFTCTK